MPMITRSVSAALLNTKMRLRSGKILDGPPVKPEKSRVNKEKMMDMYKKINELQELGHLEGARTLFEELVAGYRDTLGSKHKVTLMSMSNMGNLLERMGDVRGAKLLTEESLAGFRETLWSKHRDTLTSMNNLGVLLHDL